MATDIVSDSAELVQESKQLLEDSLEFAEARATSPLVIGCALGITAGLSVLVGYFIASKKLEAKYQKMADDQVAEVKAHYSVIRKEGKSLEQLAAQYPDEKKVVESEVVEQIIDDEGYTSYNKVEPVEEDEEITVTQAIVEATLVHRNVFESDDPDTYFDFKEELERRKEKPKLPFVITKEEFDLNETDYDQANLTYYDGDDVLADTNDSPVNELDQVVGYGNMLRFGHGSGDPNIVYIRNNTLEVDFEVAHSDGKFAKEVLGFDDELQHSDKRKLRKFRETDE